MKEEILVQPLTATIEMIARCLISVAVLYIIGTQASLSTFLSFTAFIVIGLIMIYWVAIPGIDLVKILDDIKEAKQ